MKQIKNAEELPKALRDNIDEDSLSLAIDMAEANIAIIEITGCVDTKTMKVDAAVQRLIDRAGSYTEFVPGSDGIRIMGLSHYGDSIDLHCHGEGSELVNLAISIHYKCNRLVGISGMPLVDEPFRNVENLIEELKANMYLYLNE
jgi:hypothetical protein